VKRGSAPSAGLEPAHPAPEAGALSSELRGQCSQRPGHLMIYDLKSLLACDYFMRLALLVQADGQDYCLACSATARIGTNRVCRTIGTADGRPATQAFLPVLTKDGEVSFD
jgi:hypothetical protein